LRANPRLHVVSSRLPERAGAPPPP
jgi:hypothetical protein